MALGSGSGIGKELRVFCTVSDAVAKPAPNPPRRVLQELVEHWAAHPPWFVGW